MNQVANTVILPVEEYEALRAQVLSLTKERDEWKDAAVNGGNAGYLREQLATMTKERDLLLEKGAATFRLDMAELRKQLTASQAREAKLREALDALQAAWPHTNGYAPIKLPPYAEMLALFAMVNEALALPTDTTALDERPAVEHCAAHPEPAPQEQKPQTTISESADPAQPALVGVAPLPEGCVVVPREPTEAMFLAAKEAMWVGNIASSIIYKAMIAAGEVKP